VTSLVVGWLVVTRVHCGQTVRPRPIVTINVKKLQFIHKLTSSDISKTAKITKR